MYGVELARQITIIVPVAPRRIRSIQKLFLQGTEIKLHAAFRPEAIGEAREVALPDRHHGHQHVALGDTVCQSWCAQWS